MVIFCVYITDYALLFVFFLYVGIKMCGDPMHRIKQYLKSFSIKERIAMLAVFLVIIGSYALYNTYTPKYAYWWKIQEIRLNKNFKTKPQAKANIAFIVPNLQRIGAVIMYARLTSLLKDNNYNVVFFYNRGFALKDEFADLDIPAIQATSGSLISSPFVNLLQNNFDLCIISGAQNSHNQLIFTKKIPTIWWLHEVNAWLNEFVDTSQDSKDKIAQQCKMGKDALWYVDPVCDIYQADIVAVSNLVRDALLNVPKKQITVIHNGVSEKEYADSFQESATLLYRQLKQQNSDKMVFTFVGRISISKGIEVLLRAFKSLPSDYKNKMMLYIVGANDHQYAESLQKKYRKFDNVIWTGEQKSDTLWDYYRAADVMVTPSTWNDSAPCVVTEAAMYHIPSIITTKVGSDYLIEDGKSGFIIAPDDIEALKNKLMWMIDHPQQVKDMGEAAYQKFLQTSTPEMFWKSWEEKILQKLKERGPQDI